MTDQRERVDAEQKEGSMRAAETGSNDAEWAADTWMGAVLNPEAATPPGNIDYDPETYTERYQGEAAIRDQPADSPTEADRGATPVPETRMLADRDEAGAEADAVRQTRYEMAEEVAAPPRPLNADNRSERYAAESGEEDEAGSGLGIIGLGLSALSLFLLPYLLAPAGIVLGYLAYRRNAQTLGLWAMGIGILAVLGAVLIYPFILT